jgi:hypothetical protein
VGWLRPGLKLLPLALASTPADTRYNQKLPLTRLPLSSRRAPDTNEAHDTPPAPAASSPSWCRRFKARCHQKLQLVGQVDGHALSRDNWTDEYSYQARQSRQAVGRANQCNRTIPRQSNAYPYGYVYMFYAFVHAARVFRRPARDLRRHPDIGPDRRDVGQ